MRIIAFFHSRGETARVDVSPVTDAQLAKKLAQYGFVPDDYENALAADLTQISGRREPRVEVCTDPDEWAQGSARSMRFALATHPRIIPLALRENGRIVSTGCLGIGMKDVAGFFSTSTLPEARGRGYQSALIGDRIARAKELGKRIGRATAEAGSTSERNFRRFGFTPVYTRTIWVLPPETSGGPKT